jgi:hypothetical protein
MGRTGPQGEATKAEGKKGHDTKKTNIIPLIALYNYIGALKLKITFNIASLCYFYQ